MITVREAEDIILKDINVQPAQRVPLISAVGMVLREDLIADRDQPPFDRVTMDGVAIHCSAFDSGQRVFALEGIQKAGYPPEALTTPKAGLEVMTGAVLPDGCDCVIPVEHVEIKNQTAVLRDGLEPARGMNVHGKGTDYFRGALLVPSGRLLDSTRVGVAAAIGKAEILVSQLPKIAVVGNGDELVAIDQLPEDYQIRQSNAYAIEAALKLRGYGKVSRFHIKDDREELRACLEEIMSAHDVVVLSGGVSMGKFDFIPGVLEEIGIEVLFHRVRQRPGKPFWFGKSQEGKPVFALPGNPVSTQICLYRYVLPYLNRAVGMQLDDREFASLDNDFETESPLTTFLPVSLRSDEQGRLNASPVIPNGSGDFASMARSDGFLELPEESFRFSKGGSYRLYRWKAQG